MASVFVGGEINGEFKPQAERIDIAVGTECNLTMYVQVTAGSDSEITVAWHPDPTDPVFVQLSITGSPGNLQQGPFLQATSSTPFLGLQPSTAYTFYVFVYFSVDGNEVPAEYGPYVQSTKQRPSPPPPAQEAPPSNVHARAVDYESAMVTWVPGAQSAHSRLQRCRANDLTHPEVDNANVAGNSFLDKPIRAEASDVNRQYIYQIFSIGPLGSSAGVWSNPIQLPARPPAPMPPPLLPPVSVKAAWSGAGQIVVTWAPPTGSRDVVVNVYHRVGIAPLLDTGASPWVVVGAKLNINTKSFTDTRPHLSAGLLHIYKVCAFDAGIPANIQCSTPVAAPP